jgi:hypothetical protein
MDPQLFQSRLFSDGDWCASSSWIVVAAGVGVRVNPTMMVPDVANMAIDYSLSYYCLRRTTQQQQESNDHESTGGMY